MAIYFVEAEPRCGKTLLTVTRIKDYLDRGCRVGGNVDLFLENMMPSDSRATVERLPDKPNVDHLNSLGLGYEGSRDDSKNGLLVFDEIIDFLDSRNWRDPERSPLLSWFRKSGKRRWDIIFICHDVESLDGQLYRQLCEHVVTVTRTDRLKVLKKLAPHGHVGVVRYGRTRSSMKIDKWSYYDTDVYDWYDTEQLFEDGVEYLEINGETQELDMRAPFTYLSSWHLKGRYEPEKVKESSLILKLLKKSIIIPWVIAYLIGKYFKSTRKFFGMYEHQASDHKWTEPVALLTHQK